MHNRNFVKSTFLFLFTAYMTSLFAHSYGNDITKRDEVSKPYTYEQARKGQDAFHELFMSGKKYEQEGSNTRAEEYYLKAYEFSRNSSSESVARGQLARFYEKVGKYEEALLHVNWFMEGLNEGEPSWYRYKEMRGRLLKKIEESKSQSRDERVKVNLSKLNREQQGRLIESFSDEDIEGKFKEVMQLEHSGNFAQALSKYEELLNHKDAIVAKFGADAWVMIYPAIQRTAEATGNVEKERQALLWIEEYLLNPSGNYHDTLQKLEPQTVSHLKERAQKLLS